MNLDELQRVAEAATAWSEHIGEHAWYSAPEVIAAFGECKGLPLISGQDAAHIAAFSPDLALKLIAIARAAKRVDWLVSTHNSAELPPNIFDGFDALRQSLEGVKL